MCAYPYITLANRVNMTLHTHTKKMNQYDVHNLLTIYKSVLKDSNFALISNAQ